MENIKEEVPSVLLPKTLETLSSILTSPRMSHHNNLLVSYQRPQTRSVHATLFERFALLNVLQNHSNALDAKDTDSRTLHKRAELWSEVTKKFNEKSVIQRNRHQVQTLYKNMKAKAKKYQARLLEEGEGLEKDEVSEVLLKMLGGEHQRRRLSMQHAAMLANLVGQDATHSLPGPSTSTPTRVASNAQQLLRSLNETSFLVNKVSPEMLIGPHHDLSRFLKQEMHVPSSFKFSSANVSDGDYTSVSNSNSSSEDHDRQKVPVASTLNGDPMQLKFQPASIHTETIVENQQPDKAENLEVVEIESEADLSRKLASKRSADVLTEEYSLNPQQTPKEEISSALEPNGDSSQSLPPSCFSSSIIVSTSHGALETSTQVNSFPEFDQRKESPKGSPPAKRLKLTASSDSSLSLVANISISDQENDVQASTSVKAKQGSGESHISVINISDQENDVQAEKVAEAEQLSEESYIPTISISDQENDVQANKSEEVVESSEESYVQNVCYLDEKEVQANTSVKSEEDPEKPYLPETLLSQNITACCPILHKEIQKMSRSRHRLEMKILRKQMIGLKALTEQRQIEHGLRVQLIKSKLHKNQSKMNTEGAA